MYLQLIELGILASVWAYHHWWDKGPPKPKPAREIDIPRTDEGAPVPLVYGRCRSRSPWLAWVGTAASTPNDGDDTADGAPFFYTMDMFFIVGIPFKGGACRVKTAYIDDKKLRGLLEFAGPGEEVIVDNVGGTWVTGGGFIGQFATMYDGNPAQLMCAATTPYAGITDAGIRMTVTAGAGNVPDFRGYLSILFYNHIGGWNIGNQPQPGNYSFEAAAFPIDTSLLEINSVGDDDVNPADVIYDLLTGTFGKAGIPSARIDLPSFEACAQTLLDEGHGFSRAWDDGGSVEDMVGEVLKQTDAVLRDNPTTGKIELKLIRADYNPLTVPLVTPDSCEVLEDYDPGGRTGLPNSARIAFSDRSRKYNSNSAVAQNMANAVGQDGESNEISMQMLGICRKELAQTVAGRELNYHSRSIVKCRAIVDRRYIRVMTGDVIALDWPDYTVSGKLFRVANVERGTLTDGKIKLWLLEDVFFAHRGTIFPSTLPPFPVLIAE